MHWCLACFSGLVVEVSVLNVGGPGLKSWPSHPRDVNIGVLGAILADTWHCRVRARTG